MIQREFVPRWLSSEPPLYLIDLADEVGAKEITWQIYDREGKEIGFAKTQVKQLPKGRYELRAELIRMKISVQNILDLKQCTSSYTVDTHGHLLELFSQLKVNLLGNPGSVEIKGKVENGELIPKTSFHNLPGMQEISKFIPTLENAIPVSESDSVINITHPFNRLRDLRDGQEWRVPVFNPLPSLDPAQETSHLFAKVFAIDFDWEGETIPCWRVDMMKTKSDLGRGDEIPDLRIIVRQSDGLVLQHEAHHQSMVMIMKRSS